MRIHYDSKIARILLPKKFKAIVLFGHVYFKDKKENVSKKLIYHEARHILQMKKIGMFKFYFLYLVEFVVGLFKYKSFFESYKNVSFEKDAVEYSIKMTSFKE